MQVTHSVAEAVEAVRALRSGGKSLGFVPTMGALHTGHLSLVRAAMEENDRVVVSIFVNPTQFGPDEDYEEYPRQLDNDVATCTKEKVDLLFAPRTSEMYPAGYATYVLQERYTEPFEGEIRTGHFHGVCTVCAKLFNIVRPDRAYFGHKDYQQCAVIRRMIRDLNFEIETRVCPTVRESDGLAMSSRNALLSPELRAEATCLYSALQRAQEMFDAGQRSTAPLLAAMEEIIQEAPHAKLDYVAVVNPESLREIRRIESEAVVLVAARFNGTRLLDNIRLSVDSA